MKNSGIRIIRVLVGAIVWLALWAIATLITLNSTSLGLAWALVAGFAASGAVTLAGAYRMDVLRTAGSVFAALCRWVLVGLVIAIPVISVGFLIVGVPPGWLMIAILVAAGVACAWYLIRRPISLPWLIVASLLVTLLAGQGWNWRMASLQKRIKAEGLPVSVADFARDVPAARNAFPAMEKVVDAYSRTMPGDPKESVLSISGAITDVDGQGMIVKDKVEVDDCRKWTNQSAGILDRLAARHARIFRVVGSSLTPILVTYEQREACDYKAEDKKDFAFVPRLAAYVNMNRIYKVMAERKAMGGDIAGAWKIVGLQVKLADLIAQEPSLIGKMVALADAGIAYGTAAAILKNRPGAVMPEPLARAFARQTQARWSQEGFAGEIGFFFHGRRWFRGASRWTPPTEYYRDAADWRIQKIVALTGVLDAKSKWNLEKAYLPAARAKAWVGDPWPKDDTAEGSPKWSDRWIPWQTTPRFSSLVQKQFELATKIKLALVASAVHAYRNRTGRCPARLAELGKKDIDPALLVDPFTGKELAYKTTKGGFEISSAGPWGNSFDSKDQVLKYREPIGAGHPEPKKR